MKRENAGKRINYREYRFSLKESVSLLFIGTGCFALIDELFYRSLYVLFFFLPFMYCIFRISRKRKIEKRLKKVNYDFREALNCLAVTLRAGYAVENAFEETEKDLANILGKNAEMTREFTWINSQVRLSVPAEKLLSDFAGRTGLEDIENFSAVFSGARRMGGNMADIIQKASATIGGKIDVEREIETVLAAKKYEQKIMAAMPCAIILYMQLASPGFLDVLYGNALGAAVMTGCLAVYAGAIFWAAGIVNIEI